MRIKNAIFSAVLIVSASLAFSVAAQTTAPSKSKVVLQVSEGDAGKWNLVLNVAKNVQQELGADKVQIEIVAFGPGIGMLKADSITNNRVLEAAKSGVEIVACQNSMVAQKLTKDDMSNSIGYVPAGAVELMKRQYEGWAYLRP